MPPTIPQSDALSEADPASIRELFARNPEQNTPADYDYLISYYQQLRTELASSAAVRHARTKREQSTYSNIDLSELL